MCVLALHTRVYQITSVYTCRESGHCLALMGESLRALLFFLEVMELATSTRQPMEDRSRQCMTECASWLRRVYEEVSLFMISKCQRFWTLKISCMFGLALLNPRNLSLHKYLCVYRQFIKPYSTYNLRPPRGKYQEPYHATRRKKPIVF